LVGVSSTIRSVTDVATFAVASHPAANQAASRDDFLRKGGAVTDANDLASLAPTTGASKRALEVEITASAGSSSELEFQLQAWPQLAPPVPGRAMGAGTKRCRRAETAAARGQ